MTGVVHGDRGCGFFFDPPAGAGERQAFDQQQVLDPRDLLDVRRAGTRGAPPAFETPSSGNSASHVRRTYGCTFTSSHTSAALNSARLGISIGDVGHHGIDAGQSSAKYNMPG